MNPSPDKEMPGELRRFGFLEVAVLVLSVYVLGALLAQTALHLSPEVSLLVDRIDAFVCVVFLADFVVRFRRAPSKLAFMKWGWIDLISSLPAYDFLRWGRMVRVIRIIRILRAFRSARHLIAFLYRHRTRSIAMTALLMAFVLVIFSSIAVLAFEDEKESNIRTPLDAVWWAVSTMTTVGYGDKVPVTTEGKVVAMILMVTGVGLFGVLTGLFARLFVQPELKKEDEDITRLATEIRLLRERIERMEDKPDSEGARLAKEREP
jgi:voltage-gated potassium channel